MKSKKKTYRIRVREEYTAFIEIEAENGDAALKEAERQIASGEYVPTADLSAEMSRKCSVARLVRNEDGI